MKDWCWGVDVHARKVAVAFVCDDNHSTVDVRWAGPASGAKLLSGMHGIMRRCAGGWADLYPPLSVWVERPTGAHSNPALDHAVGVTLAALYGALEHVYLHPVSVELIPIGTWKKLAVGYGNASKEQTLEWARRECGYRGGDSDHADALGVAVAGSRYAHFGEAA